MVDAQIQFKKIKNLYGLILTGGRSIRMKEDKASLKIHGKEQSMYCFELLNKFCERSFISNRQDQSQLKGQKELPQLHDADKFKNIGPLGGILTAMNMFLKVNWFVLACDLPFVNEKAIVYLIQNRNSKKLATAYISNEEKLPEPLCAIYEAKFRGYLIKCFKEGIHCPRKIMIQSGVHLLEQPDPYIMKNVNTPEELESALKSLKQAGC